MSSTNRGAVRRKDDHYCTPGWAVKLIFDRIKPLNGVTYMEPCRGDNREIWDRMPEGRKHWAEIRDGRDYLQMNPPVVNVIVTNPPFSLAMEFLRRSLSHADMVVYLLRLGFLASKKRRIFWRQNPLSHLYVLSKRPSFTGGGTDSADYAWMVWSRPSRPNWDGHIMKDVPGVHVL